MRATPRPRDQMGRRRGAAAAELAVILPLLMLIVLGCIDLGRFAYNYIAVTNAARAGAGFAMMNTFSTATQAAWATKITQAVADEMAGQTGHDPTALAVKVTPIDEGSGDLRIQVDATYPFRTLVPWPGIPSNIAMKRTVALRKIR